MGEPSKGDGLPGGLAATIALVVAGLAAVGITGDFVPRLVRDEPTRVTGYLIIALIGAGVIAVAALLARVSKAAPWVGLAGVITVLVATGLALRLGAQSVADREQPRAVLSATTSQQNTVVINVDVSGAGLRPRDDMLVQVIGIPTAPAKLIDDLPLCESSQLRSPLDPAQATLLAWQRLGPDNKGNVTGTVKIEVPPGTFQTVCAWAVLSGKDVLSPSRDDHRSAAAYLRLDPTSRTAGR